MSKRSASVPLGTSDLLIPRIGYGGGTAWFGPRHDSTGYNQALISAVERAFSVNGGIGFTHYDSAQVRHLCQCCASLESDLW